MCVCVLFVCYRHSSGGFFLFVSSFLSLCAGLFITWFCRVQNRCIDLQHIKKRYNQILTANRQCLCMPYYYSSWPLLRTKSKDNGQSILHRRLKNGYVIKIDHQILFCTKMMLYMRLIKWPCIRRTKLHEQRKRVRLKSGRGCFPYILHRYNDPNSFQSINCFWANFTSIW